MMDLTTELFNPPSRRLQKRAPSSTRSARSDSSRRSHSRRPATPVYSDLIGMRTATMPQLVHQHEPPELRFPSSTSIASKSSSTSSGSTSSNSSTSTKASSVAEITPAPKFTSSALRTSPNAAAPTPHDLFGTRVPPTEAELAPSAPNGVQLESGSFRLPESIDRQFYRDLTFMEDEELIQKYSLVRVKPEERQQEAPSSSKKARRGTMLLGDEILSVDVVKFV